MTDGRVRVLMVSPTLTGGGAERFSSTLLNHLDRSRFAPSLCLLRREMTYPLAEDVPVAGLGYGPKWTVFRTVRRLRRHIEEAQPDVVVSNIALANLVTGEALRGLGRAVRWVARFGAPPDIEVGGLMGLLAAPWLRRVYPRADECVANSRGLAGEVTRCYPFAAGKVRVIYNPADFGLLDQMAEEGPAARADGDAPVVISVGRLTEQKRPDVLLEAFARLRRRLPARLWVCGDGPLRAHVASEVTRLGLTDAVHLLGFCANPYALMRQASAFVLTSDFEGLPNALIEAQGLGLPAVSTRCPTGPDEIVEHGATGLLVAPGDVAAVADGLEEVLRDPGRRAAMGQAARERARRAFGVGAVLREWEDLLGGRQAVGLATPRLSV